MMSWGEAAPAVVCIHCGRWKTALDYLRHVFGAETTHGCCQACSDALLKDYERKRRAA